MKGRGKDQLKQYISCLKPSEMVSKVQALGFSGIYIDRYGYQDNARKLEASLKEVLMINPIVSEDGRLSFFSFEQ